MSDPTEEVQRWEAPFFEQPASSVSQVPLSELEALAQAKGFQSGKEEGMQSAQGEAREIIARMSSMAQAMSMPFADLDSLVTKELAQMAMLLAQQIVRRELAIDSSVVTDIVVEALSTVYKLEGQITVFINPADAELVRSLSPDFLEGKTWKVVEDPGLNPGGCQVKTPTSFVDASVEKQMEAIFSDLVESCEIKLET